MEDRFMKNFLLILITLVSSVALGDTPGQFINKVCPTHQWFEAIVPGLPPTCTQPQYGDLGGSVPIWNQNTTGNAATATALQSVPTGCSSGLYADAIGANGNLTCAQVAYSQISGTPSLSGFLTKSANLSDVSSQQTSLNNLLGAVTSGFYPRGDGTNVTMSAIQAADIPIITAAKISDFTTAARASISNTSPITYSLGAIGCQTASGSLAGCLSSADWNTFDSKQNALTPGDISTSTTGVTIGNGTGSTVGPDVTIDIQNANGTQPGLLSATTQTVGGAKTLTSNMSVPGILSGGTMAVDLTDRFLYDSTGTQVSIDWQSKRLYNPAAMLDWSGGQVEVFRPLSLFDLSITNAVTLSGYNGISTAYPFRFPQAQGSLNDTLINDGFGNMSWGPLSGLTVGTINSQSKSADGGVISAGALVFQTADGSFPGLVSTGSQSFAGAKTFTSTIVGDITGNAATVTTNANLTGDVTSSGNATTYNNKVGLAKGGTNADLSGTGGTSQFLKQASAGAAITVARPACADLSNSSASCATDATNASNIGSGTLPNARLPNPSAIALGGVESLVATTHQWINTISTSGVPSSTQPACSDLSGVAASCSTDTTNAGNISSGLLGLAEGGNHADLSGSGGTSQVLKQTTVGGNVSVARLACSDLSNSSASCSTDATNATNITTGTLPAAQLPAPSATTLGGVKSLAAVSHNFLTSISTAGAPTQAQPTCSDLSGVATSCSTDTTNASNITSGTLPAAQIPNPSATTLGGTQSITTAAHNFLTGISTSGVPSKAQPAFTDISGSVAASQLPNPSSSSLGGVESIAAVSHNFLTSISTSGVPTQAQPACGDLSNAATSCSTDTTNATNITTGTLSAARLPGTITTFPSFITRTTTTSAAINSNYLVSASSGWTFTLPDATTAGYAGQSIYLNRTDNSMANVILIATTSSQTIGTYGTTVHAVTQGEVWGFQSDGANWQVLTHTTETPWSTYTMVITGTSSNPTKSTSPRVDLAQWKRRGQNVLVSYMYDSTGGSGGAAGGGCYEFALPTNITMLSASTTLGTSITLYGDGSSVGNGVSSTSASSRSGNMTAFTDTSHVIMSYGASGSCWGSATTGILASSSAKGTFQLEWPATGWEP